MLSEEKILKLKKELANKNLELTKVFKTLSEPNRCKIFWMFATEDHISVGNTAKVLNISLPLASQHLKTLLDNGLLKKEKQGKKVYYELKRKDPIVKTLIKLIK
jgi:DNA-binding transcriptional ArsR family regulator